MKLNLLAVLLALISTSIYSQVAINSDGAPADSTAILDLQSTSKGFLLPRMTFVQRSAISNPADGLIVYCSDCGLNGDGVLCIYSGGEWLNMYLCKIASPNAADNTTLPNQIDWKWNVVAGATGYKWGLTDNISSALDNGADTTRLESGIPCDSSYYRYVWAYNDCGYSQPVLLIDSTASCWACGDSLTINHVAGNVAPVDKTTTYGTVSNIPGAPTKCWITSNLGSDHQAAAVDDSTEASAGWYWQFNRLQGFKHTGTTRIPTTTWIATIDESSNWVSANDPCRHELGQGWRVPTSTEWTNVDAAGSWTSWNGPWNSDLKLHAGGYLSNTNGSLLLRGMYGGFWSSTQGTNTTANGLFLFSSSCTVSLYNKATGYSLRCLKD